MILCAIPTGFIIYGFGTGFLEGLNNKKQYEASAIDIPKDRKVQIGEAPLEISLPEHWEPLQNLNENASYQAGNLRREEYFLAFAFNKIDLNTDIESLYYNSLNEFEVSLSHTQLIEERDLELLGKPAKQVTLSGTIDNLNLVYLDTIFEGEDYYYRFLCWTLPSRQENALEVFRAVLNSSERTTNEDTALNEL